MQDQHAAPTNETIAAMREAQAKAQAQTMAQAQTGFNLRYGAQVGHTNARGFDDYPADFASAVKSQNVRNSAAEPRPPSAMTELLAVAEALNSRLSLLTDNLTGVCISLTGHAGEPTALGSLGQAGERGGGLGALYDRLSASHQYLGQLEALARHLGAQS